MKKLFRLPVIIIALFLPIMVFAVTTAKTQLSNLQVIYDSTVNGTYFKVNTNPPLDGRKFFDTNVSVMPKNENGRPDYSRIAKIKTYGSQQGDIFSAFAQNFTLGKLVQDNRSDYAVEMSIGAENPCPERTESKCCYFGKEDKKYSAIIYSAASGCANPVRVDIKKPIKAGFKQTFASTTEAQTALEELFAIEKKEKIILTSQCVAGQRMGKLAISLAIDNSGSMDCGNTPGKSKLAQAQEEYIKIIRSEVLRDEDLVSIEGVSFDTKTTVINPENNREKIINAINSLKAGGDTALFDAARRAIMAVAAKDGYTKIAIIFTDGNENSSASCPGCDGNRDLTISKAKEIAALAYANNVRLFTIGLGDLTPDKGDPPEVWCQKQGAKIRVDINRSVMEALAGDSKRFINIKTIGELEGNIKTIINEGMTMPKCGDLPEPPKEKKEPQYYMPELQVAGECKKKDNAGKCDYEVCITAKCVANPPAADAITKQDWCNTWEAGYSLWPAFEMPAKLPKFNNIEFAVKKSEERNQQDVKFKAGLLSIGGSETYCLPIKAISDSFGAVENADPKPYVNIGGKLVEMNFADNCSPADECKGNKVNNKGIDFACSAQDIASCRDVSTVSLDVTCKANSTEPCKNMRATIKLADGAWPVLSSGIKLGEQVLAEDKSFKDDGAYILPTGYRYISKSNTLVVNIGELEEGKTLPIIFNVQYETKTLANAQGNIAVILKKTELVMPTPGWNFPQLSKSLAQDCLAKKSETSDPYLEVAKTIKQKEECSPNSTVRVDIKCKDECGKAGCKGISISDNFYAFDNDLSANTEKKYNLSALKLKSVLGNKLPPRYVEGSARGAGENAAIANKAISEWRDPYGLDRYLQLDINKLDKDQTISYEYDVKFLEEVDGANVNYPNSQIMMGGKIYGIHQKASYSAQNCGGCIPTCRRTITPVSCRNEFDVVTDVSCKGNGTVLIKELRDVLMSYVGIAGNLANFPNLKNNKPPTSLIDPVNRTISATNFTIDEKSPYTFNYKAKFLDSARTEGWILNLNDPVNGSVALYEDPVSKKIVAMDCEPKESPKFTIDYNSCGPRYEVNREVAADNCAKTATVTVKFKCIDAGNMAEGCGDFSFTDYSPVGVGSAKGLGDLRVDVVAKTNLKPAVVSGVYSNITLNKEYIVSYQFSYDSYNDGKPQRTNNIESYYTFGRQQGQFQPTNDIVLKNCPKEKELKYSVERNIIQEKCNEPATVSVKLNCEESPTGFCSFDYYDYLPAGTNRLEIVPGYLGGEIVDNRIVSGFRASPSIVAGESTQLKYKFYYKNFGNSQSGLSDNSYFTINGGKQIKLVDVLKNSQKVNIIECPKDDIKPQYKLERTITPNDCAPMADVSLRFTCIDPGSEKDVCAIAISDVLPFGATGIYNKPGAKSFDWTISVPKGQTVSENYILLYKEKGNNQDGINGASTFTLNGATKPLVSAISNKDANIKVDIYHCWMRVTREIAPITCETAISVTTTFTCAIPGRNGECWSNFGLNDFLPPGANDLTLKNVIATQQGNWKNGVSVKSYPNGNYLAALFSDKLKANKSVAINYKISYTNSGSQSGISDKSRLVGFAEPTNLIEFFVANDPTWDKQQKVTLKACSNQSDVKMIVPAECPKTSQPKSLNVAFLVDTSDTMVCSKSLCNANDVIKQISQGLSSNTSIKYQTALINFTNYARKASGFESPANIGNRVNEAMNAIFDLRGGSLTCGPSAIPGGSCGKYNVVNGYDGATNMCDGLAEAYSVLKNSNGNNLLIMLSDGLPNRQCSAGGSFASQADLYPPIADWMDKIANIPNTKIVIINYNYQDDPDQLYTLITERLKKSNKSITISRVNDSDGRGLKGELSNVLDASMQCIKNSLSMVYPNGITFYEPSNINYANNKFRFPIVKDLDGGERRKFEFRFRSNTDAATAIQTYKSYLSTHQCYYNYTDTSNENIPHSDMVSDKITFEKISEDIGGAGNSNSKAFGTGVGYYPFSSAATYSRPGATTKTTAAPKPALIPKSQADSLLNLINALKIKK